MTDHNTTDAAPTAQDIEAGGEVVSAGAAAAAAEKDPAKRKTAAAKAIKDSAEEKGWKLSPEDAEMLAGMVAAKTADLTAEKTVEKITERGGFDKLPDPIAPPPAPTGTGTLPAQPANAAPAGDRDETPPARSQGASAFARWFRGA